MRILFAGDIRAPHMWRYARYFQSRGHTCAVASAEYESHVKADYVIETAAGPDWIKYPSGVPSFKKIIDDFRPALINSHFIPNYGFMAMLSGFHPHALTIWGSDLLISAEKSILHKIRARKILHSADILITDADMLTSKAREYVEADKKILTVPFGIEKEYLEKGRQREIKIGGSQKIISTRQLKPLYRVEDFIKALAHVKEELDFDAIVAGDGELRDDLIDLSNNFKLSNIKFTGALDRDDLMNLLLETDIYISCSESDSTSVSLLEAMACGLFPIVSDIEGNREWIQDGMNGILFAVADDKMLADKIRQAISDLALRKQAIQHNFDLIEKKALWEDVMAGVEREFESLGAKS